MAIDKKLIHFGKLADFEAQLTAGNILDRSIVFIQDAKKIWTHGTYYDCSESVSPYADNVYITDFTVNDLENAIVSQSNVVADLTSLEEALAAHKVVLVPYDAGDGFLGYGILVGYAEDLLYLSIYSGGYDSVFYEIEADRGDTSIRYQNIFKRTWSDKQDKLVSGTNIKTFNGESILGEGDLTVEGGAKVYTWNWDGSESGTLTQDEYDGIVGADIVYVAVTGGIPTQATMNKDGDYRRILISQFVPQANGTIIVVSLDVEINEDKSYKSNISYILVPTKTSQLENDSNFVSSDGLKTINGESIVGSGNIEVGKANYVELSGASVTISSMLENTFYYDATPLTSLTISAFTSSGNPKDEYKAVFKAADGMSLTLPSDMYWANGTIPEIEADVFYELSIERSLDVYKAVLVPFKSV